MTTIAANLAMMVADRLEDDSGTKRKTTKIFRVKNSIIGTSGDSDAGFAFMEWYKDRRRHKPDLGDFEALVLSHQGLHYYTSSLTPENVGPQHAIGTGKPYVMAALMAGSDIVKAVKIAIELDMYSGYEPQVMRLRDDT